MLTSFAVSTLDQVFKQMHTQSQLPIGAEDDFRGIIDLIKMKAEIYTNDLDANILECWIPWPSLREKLVEAVAETDEKWWNTLKAKRNRNEERVRDLIRINLPKAVVHLPSRTKGVELLQAVKGINLNADEASIDLSFLYTQSYWVNVVSDASASNAHGTAILLRYCRWRYYNWWRWKKLKSYPWVNQRSRTRVIIDGFEPKIDQRSHSALKQTLKRWNSYLEHGWASRASLVDRMRREFEGSSDRLAPRHLPR